MFKRWARTSVRGRSGTYAKGSYDEALTAPGIDPEIYYRKPLVRYLEGQSQQIKSYLMAVRRMGTGLSLLLSRNKDLILAATDRLIAEALKAGELTSSLFPLYQVPL